MHDDRPTSMPGVKPPPDADLALCVLSSSSGGNCSALLLGRGEARRLYLIDLGLSPRRTRALLGAVGVGDLPISGVLLTHLDDDHCNPAWASPGSGLLSDPAPWYIHKRHRGRAQRAGFLHRRTLVFEDGFDLPTARVRVLHTAHDDLGVATFRFECEHAHLGFATDVGHAGEDLVRHLHGLDVLAIESNYCPRMQRASARPEFLKRRIMGGHGHLSNQQCAQAVALMAPREHVVLLHLSRQCNSPPLAAAGHAGRPYALTIARHDAPTAWVFPSASHPRSPTSSASPAAQGLLF